MVERKLSPTRSGFWRAISATMTSFGVSGLAWSNITHSWPARFSTDESDMMPMGGKPMTRRRPLFARVVDGIA